MGEDLPGHSGEPSERILNERLAYLLHWFSKIQQQELPWFHLYQSVADLLDVKRPSLGRYHRSGGLRGRSGIGKGSARAAREELVPHPEAEVRCSLDVLAKLREEDEALMV